MSDFLAQAKNNTLGATEVEARQLAEMKSKIFLAKQFPRDQQECLEKILNECQITKIAESAIYSYPRGDTEVKGPSIRLAEVIARNWGNFTSGVTELDNRNGESVVKTYAWDLETNFSDEKIFTVKHERVTKKGTYALTDPRDIYELVANQGARRKRACIFAIIPSHVVDMAMEQCQKTLEESLAEEKIETVREKMLEAFGKLSENITKEVLEAKIGKPFDKFNTKDIIKLRNLYNAINDGFVKADVAFGLAKEVVVNEEDDQRLEAINGTLFGDKDV